MIRSDQVSMLAKGEARPDSLYYFSHSPGEGSKDESAPWGGTWYRKSLEARGGSYTLEMGEESYPIFNLTFL